MASGSSERASGGEGVDPARRSARRPARPQSPRGVVAALWRERPPPIAPAADPRGAVEALQRSLSELSTHADMLAIGASATIAGEALLLAQTARSLHAFLDLRTVGGGRDALLRIARLERWLALRAQQEPAAQCAADLAVWALEHYEAVLRG